jgi:GNAT superfamily N-acetyltransferase
MLSAGLLVRPLKPEDREAWAPLWDGYNAFYGRHGSTGLPATITETTWNRFFDAYEPVHAQVAERDGKLLGLVHYLFHRSTTLLGPTCYLQDLFTDETQRGQGVGRALIEAVYAHAQAGGAERVYWLTQQGNSTARRLYDTMADESGFVVYRKVIQK